MAPLDPENFDLYEEYLENYLFEVYDVSELFVEKIVFDEENEDSQKILKNIFIDDYFGYYFTYKEYCEFMYAVDVASHGQFKQFDSVKMISEGLANEYQKLADDVLSVSITEDGDFLVPSFSDEPITASKTELSDEFGEMFSDLEFEGKRLSYFELLVAQRDVWRFLGELELKIDN